ncbi:MAG: hypothetical protein IKW81_10220 [Pseudobutyrivibrio sp.]|nr:hypothetical protein [Pseudobutyrivibrio sp.]
MRGILESIRYFFATSKAARIVLASVLGVSAVGAGGAGIYAIMNDTIEEEVVEEEVVEEAAAEDVYIPVFKTIVLTSESLEKDLTIYISDEEDNAVTGVPFQVKLLKPDTAKSLQTNIDEIASIDEKISEVVGPEDNLEDILRDRNVDITVTDENGDVVETQKGRIKDDPLYQLFIDKEEAIQSYAMAVKNAEGNVYTDEDQDGVIAEKDMEPGDYVACLVNDFDSEEIYTPSNYATEMNVKNKVEYKVQKEITKQIKKAVAAEDQQPKEAAPVEAELKDTVEWVESKRVENGAKAVGVAGSDVVAPKTTADSSKATVKGESRTSVTYPKASSKLKANNRVGAFMGGIHVDSLANVLLTAANEGAASDGEGENTATSTPTPKVSEEPTTTPTQEEKDKPSSTPTPSPSASPSPTATPSPTASPSPTATPSPTASPSPSATPSPTATPSPSASPSPTSTLKPTKVELKVEYSKGTFKISTSALVGSVKVNGADVSMNNNAGTFKATSNGDYKVTAVATFEDKHTEELYVTYTVSGFGTASGDRLKDKADNELFLDEGLTKPATAADYSKDKTYYYKTFTYIYYGWQSIDGASYYFDKNGNKVTGEQVIRGVKYNFGSDGALLPKGTGIDVSKYQGNIDWNQAKSAVSFAIIRCGYRGKTDGQLYEDEYFYKNMKNAKAAGVATGVYIFSRAVNEAEAVQEASMAVAMAQKAGGCAYPIFIDMEDTARGGGLSAAQRTAIANAFIATVQSSGYKAGLYCSKNWMNDKMSAGSLNGSAYIWIAQYNTQCTYGGKYSMWQYSSKGSVPGIKGNVDMNRSFF